MLLNIVVAVLLDEFINTVDVVHALVDCVSCASSYLSQLLSHPLPNISFLWLVCSHTDCVYV